MNEEILNNIWTHLSDNNLTNNDFDVWRNNFIQNENIRDNIYGYLLENNLTKSSKEDWLSNTIGSQLDDDFSVSYDLPQVDVTADKTESQEDDTAIERVLGKNFATDFLGDLWRAGEQGLAQGATVDEAFDVYKKGKNISDEELRRYIEVSDALDKTGVSDEMREYEKIKEEAGGGVWGFMKGMIQTRGQVIPQVIVSSAAAMGRTFFDSEEAAAATGAGALSGAGLGTAVGPIGTATGAIGGAVAGLTGSMETALTMTELLKTELGDKDFNKENIRAILEDEELFEDIKDRALARGATIGAVEGITVGLARGVGAKLLAKKATKGQIARKVTGIEMTGGAGGEALGQVAARQEFDIAEVLMEGVAEAKGVVNVADILAKKEYKINGEPRTRQEVLDKINNTKAENLAKIQFEITGDNTIDQAVKQKQAEAVFETQIDERVGEVDRKKLVELEKKRAKAEADTKKKGIFAVPGAETTLENIQNDIDNIIKQYEGVDRRTAEVRARKKAATEVRADIAERDFQTNLEFAKKHSALYGLEVDDTLTLEQIKKQYGNNAALSDGFVDEKTNKIIINKTVAKLTKAVNVGNHELLHGILRKALKEGKINRNLIKDLEVKLGKNNWSKVQQRIIDGDYGNMTVKAEGDVAKRLGVKEGTEVDYLQANPDEYLTLLSDAIANNEIQFNEGLFSSIEELLLPVFRAFGFKEINFDSADGVYDFLKEYNKSIHKGTLSSAIVKATEGKVDIKGRGEVFAKSNIQGILEEYGGKEATKPDLRRMVNETLMKTPQGQETFDITKSRFGLEIEPIVEAITKRLYDKIPSDATRAAGLTRADYKNALVSEAATMTQQEYDATIQDLDTFISNRLNLRAESLAKRLGVEEKILKDVDFIKETDIDIVDKPTPKIKPTKKEKTRKLQHLKDIPLENKEIISKSLKTEIETLIKENPKDLVERIKTVIKKAYVKEVRKQMGGISKKEPGFATDKYKAFHALAYSDIVKSLDVDTIKNNYKNLFDLKKIGKEDRVNRKIDNPNLKKDSYYRKDIFEIGTNKAKWTKYFTEGGYTTLIERQRGLANLIVDSFIEDAVNNYIAENSNDLNEIVKAELRNYSNTLNRRKSEEYSFDSIKFSKSLNKLSPEKQMFFFENIVEVAGNMNPALVDLLEWKNVKNILEETYGEKLTSSELTAIAKDFVSLISRFQPAVSKNKPAPREQWTEYVVNSFAEADNSIIKMLNLEINGKKPTAASLYDNKQNIERGRRKLIEFGNYLIDNGTSIQEVANIMAMLKPMYAGNSKVGRGMFYTDEKGFVRTVKLAKGKKFGSPRNQIFESVPMFEKWGVMQIKGMTKEAWSKAAKLKAQNSKAAIKDKDYKGRLAEAKKARQVIDSMMRFLSEKGNDLDIAMFMVSNLSTMDAPLRRAANLKYIADEVLKMDVKQLGKLAEYEHMIPANVMALKIIDAYKNEGGIKDQDNFYNDYNVAIIPKSMDKILKQLGLQSNMLPGHDLYSDPSWQRYYNFLTAGMDGIVPIRDISNNKLVGVKFSKSIKNTNTLNDAVKMSRSIQKESKGITVLDFDDTLATTKSLVKFTRPDGTTGTLNAEEYASTYEDLLDKGYKFDFSDFNKVVKGKLAPLFQKALKLQKKFGPENMFVLTARPPAAQKPIFDFLKANGLNIPIKNITGLANSTAEAKALWIADKVGEGYNDFYFADDALQNVQAVDDVLNQLGVKRKVQQAKVKFSKSLGKDLAKNKNYKKFRNSLKGSVLYHGGTASLSDNKAVWFIASDIDGAELYAERRDGSVYSVNSNNLNDAIIIPDVSDLIGLDKVIKNKYKPIAKEVLDKYGQVDIKKVLETDVASEVISDFMDYINNNFELLDGVYGPETLYDNDGKISKGIPVIVLGGNVSTKVSKVKFSKSIQTIPAVANMLDQFDVKSKVQQAKVKFSKSMNKDFNDILENVTGIESKKRFSAIKARKRGADKGKFRFFIPPSHEDFVGLLYNFMGKGKEGNAHRDFFEKALIRPLNRAYRELNAAKQSIANDYKSLNKQFTDIKKKLIKKTPDGDFTYQDAVRVYLWDKHGYDIPGLSPTDQQNLVDLVMSDPELQTYAETLNIISKQDKYVAPTESWEGGDIRTDLDDATGRIGRGEFFAEFNENVETIFSQENLNKIEAAYGDGVVSAIKDMLYRIKTGQNRPSGQNKQTNQWLNYLNGSVAATMFFNIRSAVLQQMSLVNFINYADNNILASAKAFANQKQYWTDWAKIFNSDFMKQRRKGIKTDVNGAELAASVKGAKNPAQAAIKKLLELGFLPTQIGDNIAIATGGAPFLRNRINTYLKQGMSQKEAEAKAWTDFEILAEATQQSARPDMVSQQQASPLGKVILAFQNVTSQFNRLGKKAFLDIKNRRITPGNTTQLQSDMSNLSRIAYYFAIQNIIFYTLQSALFMAMFDDDEDDERMLAKKERVINGTLDSVLRGTGVWGAAISTLKNMAFAYHKERAKDWNGDEASVLVEGLNVSPPLGIKARKIVNAERTLNYNRKTIDEMETLDIDNPQWSANTSYIEAITNIPLNRLYNKTQNIRESLNNQHDAFERALLFSGWSKWNIGVEDVEKDKKKQKFGDRKKSKKKKVQFKKARF